MVALQLSCYSSNELSPPLPVRSHPSHLGLSSSLPESRLSDLSQCWPWLTSGLGLPRFYRYKLLSLFAILHPRPRPLHP